MTCKAAHLIFFFPILAMPLHQKLFHTIFNIGISILIFVLPLFRYNVMLDNENSQWGTMTCRMTGTYIGKELYFTVCNEEGGVGYGAPFTAQCSNHILT